MVLNNCEIKHSRLNPKELEILVTPRTEIGKSNRKYDIDCDVIVDINEGMSILLDKVVDLNPFQRVQTEVKVHHIDEPIQVNGDKIKQDVIIKDKSGDAKLTVWDEDVNTMTIIGKSYKLTGMLV